MKSVSVLGLFAALAASQQLSSPNQRVDLDKGMTRAQIGHKLVPGGVAADMQQLKPRLQKYHPNVRRTKVRYGPFRLPSSKSAGVAGEAGSMMTFRAGMKKPCTGRCNLLLAQADLEFANGTVAANKEGAWLHHVVFTASGSGHSDTVCGMGGMERFFSSGNERTPTSFGDVLMTSPVKVKSAFPLKATSSIGANIELMNLNTVIKSVYLTVDWEWFPPTAADDKIWKRARAMWLDITGCGASFKGSPMGKRVFEVASPGWTSKFNGDMLGVGGHLHDGGTVLNILQNGKVICASKANYAVGGHSHKKRSTTHMLSRRDGPSSDRGDGKLHIDYMTTCTNMGRIKVGDRVQIKANYDYTKHNPMKTKGGGNAAIMGIAIMYAAQDV